MKMNEYFEKLLPEEVELSSVSRDRILKNAGLQIAGRKNRMRPVRLGLIAACLTVILSITAVAVYRINWNADYRERFHVQSEDVQGFVEYPDVEVTEEASLQPVSCVTGITMFECRFSYGPISQEEAQNYDYLEGDPEQFMEVDIEELPKYSPDAALWEYDSETGMALFTFSVWREEMPAQLSMTVLKRDMKTGEVLEELGTLVMHPEEAEMKSAKLDLPVTASDGREAKILELRVDTGSYCWVYDIPGMDEWNGDFDAAISDPVFSSYACDISNRALEQYVRESYITYRGGATTPIGGGLGPVWDGAHFCEWCDGVYDIANLVSVTINGVEYPLE